MTHCYICFQDRSGHDESCREYGNHDWMPLLNASQAADEERRTEAFLDNLTALVTDIPAGILQ